MHMKNAAGMIVIVGLLSGYSVGMALSGKDTPDLGVVKQNACVWRIPIHAAMGV
jgi:hypothetical protein